LFSEKSGLHHAIIRVPYLYGHDEKNTFLHQSIRKIKNENVLEIHAYPQSKCNFVHVEDVAEFIERLIAEPLTIDGMIFNLYGKEINFEFFTNQMQIYLPALQYKFLPTGNENPLLRSIQGENAKKYYDWIAERNLINDMAQMVTGIQKPTRKRRSLFQSLRSLTGKYKILLVWIEVVLGAWIMHLLTQWSDMIVEFKLIDYRLLYVVLIGSIHGLLYGILAAVLAILSGLYNWYQVGLDWALMVYNIENWIPFALYLLAGTVTGYAHDKSDNDIMFEQNQTELIHEKYEFLYRLYEEISNIKNKLRDQLVGYRDSFGRFFRITGELNQLNEDSIFVRAIEVLEDIMQNNQIAIYSISSSGHFGRLEVKSKGLERQIPRSIRLDEYGEALETLHSGEIFQNTDLIPNYPSYMAPILNDTQLIGLVVIWEADFEQFTMYYYNLFKVVTGLIQSSLVRAALFRNVTLDELYLPNTRILRPQPFDDAIKIRLQMKRGKIANFQAMRIFRDGKQWKVVYELLSKAIRDDDIVGVMDEDDSYCLVLFPQAEEDNISVIQQRIQENGLRSEYVKEVEREVST